jgi:hypothetical protein
VWDYLAGWYEAETGLDNSILLEPLKGEQSDYVLINHARWDGNLLLFMARHRPRSPSAATCWPTWKPTTWRRCRSFTVWPSMRGGCGRPGLAEPG